VGIAAIQIAKQISQVTVFTTAGSDDKCAFCKSIGADFAINYKTNPDFATYIMEQTENRGVDLIIDFIGRDYFQLNLNSAAVDASIVVLALMSGSVINSPVDISAILRKRVAIKGSTLRARTDDYKARLAREMSSFVMPRVLAGSIKPKVFAKFPLEEVISAHQMMERNENIGKIVLEIV
jgi:NADPH:quinone reductase-like Zn-dependent oxidoreductase